MSDETLTLLAGIAKRILADTPTAEFFEKIKDFARTPREKDLQDLGDELDAIAEAVQSAKRILEGLK